MSIKFRTFKKQGVWGTYDVSTWDQVSLFNPINPEENERWGEFGKVNLCEICLPIYEIFLEKKGTSNGLILFSHSLIEKNKIMSFVEFLLQNSRIKKIQLLQLEEIHTSGKITEKRIQDIISKLEFQRVMITEFSHYLQENKINPFVAYEIFKEKYF